MRPLDRYPLTNQTVTAYGSYPACGCLIPTGFGSASVTVQDDDGATLRVGLAAAFVGEGHDPATTGTVTRNTATGQALTVTLTSSNTGEASVAFDGAEKMPTSRPSD